MAAKRQEYVKWEEYFMALAVLASKRSKDPSKQVGACIIGTNKNVVGVGWNGMPTGLSDDVDLWDKNTESKLKNKHTYLCHAELNAIAFRSCADVRGCTIYTTLFPCNECAKYIIQSGISKVVYLSDEKKEKEEYKASRRMLTGVKIITLEKYEQKGAYMVFGKPFEFE